MSRFAEGGSITVAARALEEYVVATVRRRAADLANRESPVRPVDLLDLAERVETELGAPAVDLVDLLVDEHFRKVKKINLPDKDLRAVGEIIGEMRSTIGTTIADAIGLMVSAATSQVETRSGSAPAIDSGCTNENPPPSRYRGVYRAGEKYRWADEVTHSGCRWWAKWDTDSRPGDGEGNGWQLTHKSLERARAAK